MYSTVNNNIRSYMYVQNLFTLARASGSTLDEPNTNELKPCTAAHLAVHGAAWRQGSLSSHEHMKGRCCSVEFFRMQYNLSSKFIETGSI